MIEDYLIPFISFSVIIIVLVYLYRALKTAAILKKINELPQACHDFWLPVVTYFPYESSLEKNLFTLSGHAKILKDYHLLISKGRALSHATYIWNRNLSLKETQDKALQTEMDAEIGRIRLGKGAASAFNETISVWINHLTQKALDQFKNHIDKFEADPNQVYDGIQYWTEIDKKTGELMKTIYDQYLISKKVSSDQIQTACCEIHKIRSEVKTNKRFESTQKFATWLICPECKSHKHLVVADKIVGLIGSNAISELKNNKMYVNIWNAETKSAIFHPIEALEIILSAEIQPDWVISSFIDVYSNRLGDELKNIPMSLSKDTKISENTQRLVSDFKIKIEYK